ncbi:MAG: helix-turn-helix domain-containing protein [Alphaproteobacteria bacterium]|nr:helix-turn-helix domain-containing protein [Alphaproteobacteria bacterium]
MTDKTYIPNEIDQHIGKRMQIRRTMLGLSLKDLAKVCGVTFQQIQKYESADNRIAASRLFEIGAAMQTPISFFFMGLPGNMPDETKANRSMRVSQQSEDDPLAKNESLTVIKLYWQLPEKQRELIMQMLKTLNGTTSE